MPKLNISLLPETFAICWINPDATIPQWALGRGFASITRTQEELSIVCDQVNVPEGTRYEADWRCLKVEGPLNFDITGVLASMAMPLAGADVSVFAISTFDTDYLLVRETKTKKAIDVLSQEGHRINKGAGRIGKADAQTLTLD